MPKRMLLKCNRRRLIKNHAAQNALFCRAMHEAHCLRQFLKGYGMIQRPFTSMGSFSLTHRGWIRSLWQKILSCAETSLILDCPAHCHADISVLGHRTGKCCEYCYSSSKVSHSHTTNPLPASPLGT